MHYVSLLDTSGDPLVYGDDGESFEIGASLTDGAHVDHVYFSAQLGENNFHNQIGGTSVVDLLLGLSGDDTFFISAGVDWVYGGPEDDRINYVNASLGTGGGDDTLGEEFLCAA